MRVTFFGVRGSVPAPGPTTARYGGNTSCVEVELEDETIVILDAGTGLRALGAQLLDADRHRQVHLLLSHTHWDHILGLPFFGPLWRRDSEVLVYPLPTDAQERFQRTIFDDIHFPVSSNDIPAKVGFVKPTTEPWRVGSAKISRIALNHPGSAQGFRIEDSDGSVITYLTDNELLHGAADDPTLDALARFSENAALVIHDSQYISSDMPGKKGWGHSVVDDVLELGARAEARKLVLFHHDPNRTDQELDAIGDASIERMKQRALATEIVVASEGLTLQTTP
jgi:phosphoribosyl 1,2-cyclic phosphodiesterase